ncbi:MAG: 3-deoxy-7-phosphoheptulonate synthase, partial [Gemmatimonadota bacterium]
MIIVMNAGAPAKELRAVIAKIKALGYTPHTIHGKTRNVVGAIGDERGKFVLQSLESLPGVERVVPILKPYKLASREVQQER